LVIDSSGKLEMQETHHTEQEATLEQWQTAFDLGGRDKNQEGGAITLKPT
jgi:hypothetical protein